MTIEFKNRIISYGSKPASSFTANPQNFRDHPSKQLAGLRGLLSDLGWIGVVIENKTTGRLIDGHARIEEALKTGDPDVPFVLVDLTEDEERLALATFDPIGALAKQQKDSLRDLLTGLNGSSAELQKFLESLGDSVGLERITPGGGGDDFDITPVDGPTRTHTGDLWQLGDHRLLVGDCCLFDLDRLLDGDSVDLIVTSPPYAVGKEYEVDVSFAQHLELLRGFADLAVKCLKPGGFAFINFGEIAAQSHSAPLTGSSRQCIYPISGDYWRIFHEERHFDLYAARIWYKPFHRLQQPFWSYHTSIPHHQEWEHLWTWRAPGGETDEVFDWDISVHAIWDTRNEGTEDRPLTRHVAAFPICLPERAIRAHSKRDHLVLDPFAGSGTTLIAAERHFRRARLIEIEPAYCDVILRRWEAETGREAQLIDRITDGSSEVASRTGATIEAQA